MNDLTALAQLSPPGGSGPRQLSRKQKAAIIVRFLLNEGAEVPLSELDDSMQAELTHIMGGMRYIDRDTLSSVVMEFAEELESVGLSFPRDIAGALNALEGKISPMTAARLRKEAGVRQSGDPWEQIRNTEVEELAPILEAESTEVAAVMLSKLDVTKAATLLALVPGELARRITYAVSLTEAVTPDAVYRIGLSLATQLSDRPIRAFDEEPVDRVGAILNFSQADTRDDVLNGLEEKDKDFAERVRKAIFTFVNIPERIHKVDVPKIIRDTEQSILVTAMAGAQEGELLEATNFLLDNMSSRMADNLREEIRDKGKVKGKDADEAMTSVVTVIRGLQASGEISFIDPDEEEE